MEKAVEKLLSLSVNGKPVDVNLGFQSGQMDSFTQINDKASINISVGNDTGSLSTDSMSGITSRSVWKNSKAIHQIKQPSDSTNKRVQDRHYAARKPSKSKSKHDHNVDKTQTHVQGM